MLKDTLNKLIIPDPKDASDKRHNFIVEECDGYANRRHMAAALLQIVDGLNKYAAAFKTPPWNEDKTPVGRDGYAAPYFLDIAKAVTGLLAVDSRDSRLNCGKVHSAILEILHTNGYTEEETA